jgi:hypothetical protein
LQESREVKCLGTVVISTVVIKEHIGRKVHHDKMPWQTDIVVEDHCRYGRGADLCYLSPTFVSQNFVAMNSQYGAEVGTFMPFDAHG